METVTDTTELTPEPTMELEPHEPEHTNGHAEVVSKSRARRHAIQAPPSAPEEKPISVFDRLADNLRELDEEEKSLRGALDTIVEAKSELLAKLMGSDSTVLGSAARSRAAMRTLESVMKAEEIAAFSGPPPARKRGRKATKTAKPAAESSLQASLPKPRKRSGAKRHRRTAAELSQGVDAIVALVGKNKKGLGAEAIREALKFDRKAIPQLLAMALEAKRLVKTGQKRSTLYTVKK